MNLLVQIAVAANFAVPAKELATQFERASGHKTAISVGSTGKFYAQIRNGAPFDVFLSADEETPRRLEEEKLAVAGTRFTYAIGRLVLWSPQLRIDAEVLRTGNFKRLAIANPRLAPYGAAAQAALEKLGLWSAMQPRLVQGENIAQTFQFVASGNAELGFVALSQIAQAGGSHWVVPAPLHAPLRQDAVLLVRGEKNPAAKDFLVHLRNSRERIRSHGYE